MTDSRRELMDRCYKLLCGACYNQDATALAPLHDALYEVGCPWSEDLLPLFHAGARISFNDNLAWHISEWLYEQGADTIPF